MSGSNRRMRRNVEKKEKEDLADGLVDLQEALREINVRVARLEAFTSPEGPLANVINQILSALLAAKIIKIKEESSGGVDLSAAPNLREVNSIVLATARGQSVGDPAEPAGPAKDQD